jgi:hypothetical protein
MPHPGKLLVLAAALAVFAPGASGYASYVGCERSLVDGEYGLVCSGRRVNSQCA